MRILVTGGAGYIGSALVRALVVKGHSVRNLDNFATGDRSQALSGANPEVELIEGDIRDSKLVRSTLRGIDAVVHLAALMPVTNDASEKEQHEIDEVNVRATLDIIKSCEELGVGRLIFASSSSVYGKATSSNPATEKDVINPTTLYARSKAAAEQYVLTSGSPGFAPLVVRLANVFGLSPVMRFVSLANRLVWDAAIHKELILYDAEAWRPFLHVHDITRAMTLFLDAPAGLISGQVFNVGRNSIHARKVDLAELIRLEMPDITIKIVENQAIPRSYYLSFDKIETTLGFSATVTLKHGIREMIAALHMGGFQQ